MQTSPKNTVRNLRVGIIGAGANSRDFHIPKLQAIPGVDVVSVANRGVESGEKIAQEFGIRNVCASWRELLADESIDAVVIGTWPDTHAVLACAALEHGKHVLCEARMSRDAAEAHRMLRSAEEHPHLVAQLVPAPFTFRLDRTIQELIASGYIGDPLAVDVRVSSPGFIDRAGAMRWRSEFVHTGYNAMTLGIWYETLMRWVGEATRVAAMSKVFVKQSRDASTGIMTAITVPDHIDVVAKMACGAQANMRFSTVTGLPAATSSVWIHGSEGTLRVDRSPGRLWGGRRGEAALAEIEIAPEKVGEWRVEQDFVDSIRNGAPVRLTSFADGVRYMEFTEAVARGAATGATIALPLASA